MITGHFGLAAGVKKIAPRLPLWSLLLATFWLDVIFTIFSMFGLESFAPMNPAQPMYGEVIINAHYTHSLIGALLISLLTGWLASLRWEKDGGLVIGAVVFSHWILDLLVHRPDLPFCPAILGIFLSSALDSGITQEPARLSNLFWLLSARRCIFSAR